METEVKEKTERTVNELNALIESAVDGKMAGKMTDVAKMSDVDARIAKFAESQTPKETEVIETAEMESGFASSITKTKVFGVEVGKIAVGSFGGIFIGEIVDGFMAAQGDMTKGIVKLAAAGATVKWGRKWLGADTANAIAFVLGVFGLSQVLPIDKYATNLASYLKGILPGTIKVVDSRTVREAEKVAGDYTSRMSRRD